MARELDEKIQLSQTKFQETPTYGNNGIRDGYTARATHGISAWNSEASKYSEGQINKGNNSISKIEVVTSLNINNYATCFWHYNDVNSSAKYSYKLYLGYTQGVSRIWNYDSTTHPTWPESLHENITLPYHIYQNSKFRRYRNTKRIYRSRT